MTGYVAPDPAHCGYLDGQRVLGPWNVTELPDGTTVWTRADGWQHYSNGYVSEISRAQGVRMMCRAGVFSSYDEAQSAGAIEAMARGNGGTVHSNMTTVARVGELIRQYGGEVAA